MLKMIFSTIYNPIPERTYTAFFEISFACSGITLLFIVSVTIFCALFSEFSTIEFDFSNIAFSISCLKLVFSNIKFDTGLYSANVKIIAIIPANNFAPNFTSPFLYPKIADKTTIATTIKSIAISIFYTIPF